MSVNGSVIETFNDDTDDGDKLRSLTVGQYLQAAGVQSLDEDTLR